MREKGKRGRICFIGHDFSHMRKVSIGEADSGGGFPVTIFPTWEKLEEDQVKNWKERQYRE